MSLSTATTQAGATPGLSLGTATTTSAAPAGGFSFGTGGTSLTAPIKPLATTTVAAAPAPPPASQDPAAAAATPQLNTTTTTTQSSTANMSQMNFRQLQEAINKWMIDLQEQEKIFLEQATKVNAWDRTLIDNGDKIGRLNESVTKVKADHTRLEHAVEYLKNQQKEFDAFLEPLEAGLPVNVPVEPEREHLYSLTESVDTQLQQMAEDLKEVIRHINESNKTVDKNDPVSQILRILNEHTDALQWVEDNANAVRKSLDNVSKQHQVAKKEHERSLRTMFK
ncbi:Nuclear pore glycoprotein p62 [Orchesella cincta]|uniref:Nuclear pore glycoprotein p62 n=1 Tax=Orchesella cincta TaxID=48709 RepID=A0A1D2MVU6_ORCCI|nr:Nuclear pore glycoprotein p62 [Orchesella cincta]